MAFFNGLFSIITVIAIFAFMIGLIKPSIFRIKGKSLNRKTASLYTWGIAIVASLLSSLTMSEGQKVEEKLQQEQYIAKKNAGKQTEQLPKMTESGKSSDLPSEEFKENKVTHCMRSAGVDLDNPSDNVSTEQLAKTGKCLGI